MVREFLRSIFGNRQSSSTAHDMAIRQHYVASHKLCTVIAHQLLLYEIICYLLNNLKHVSQPIQYYFFIYSAELPVLNF